MKKYNENVFVFPSEMLAELPPIKYYSNAVKDYVPKLLHAKRTFFLDRNVAEDDPTHKQIIPYITIKSFDKYLTVQRSKRVGESRLAGLHSLGFGGHINESDVNHQTTGDELGIFTRGFLRELEEELSFDSTSLPVWYWSGVINDDSTPVNSVHFGIHFIIPVGDIKVTVRDPNLINAEWLTLEELRARRDNFEAWSQYVIDNL